MTQGIKLHEAMASRMRTLASDFDTELSSEISAAARRFRSPLLQRPQNPFTGHARRVLTDALVGSQVQPGDEPGLRIPAHNLLDKAHLADLNTPAMREKGRRLVVFEDLTAIYIEGLDGPGTVFVRALPTPLRLRSRICHIALNKMLSQRARRTLYPHPHGQFGEARESGIVVGENIVASCFWIAGENDHSAPVLTDMAKDWVVQFEAEISHLSQRLGRQPKVRTERPCKSALEALPLVFNEKNAAYSGWMTRKKITDEDLHLGALLFDPEDPSLTALNQAIDIALRLACAQIAPDRRGIMFDIKAATPVHRHINFNIGRNSAEENIAIGERIIDLLSLDVLGCANRFVIVPYEKAERSRMFGTPILLRYHVSGPAPSNHEQFELLEKLQLLKAEIREREAQNASDHRDE